MSSSAKQGSAKPQEAASDYFGIEIPFMDYIGLRPGVLEKDYCRNLLPLSAGITNSRGDVHGGALMSALDCTMSIAARSHDPLHTGVVTIEMSTHFLSNARSDLTVIGRAVRRGSSIVFCEGEIVDAKGQTVTISRATFKLIKRAA